VGTLDARSGFFTSYSGILSSPNFAAAFFRDARMASIGRSFLTAVFFTAAALAFAFAAGGLDA